MPTRKICPKCYFINEKNDSFCAYCNEDIAYIGNQSIDSEILEHPFFKDGQSFDECPVELKEPEVQEVKEEQPKVRMVKVCEVCGTKNSPKNPFCSKCNHILMGTEAVPDVEEVKAEETPKEEPAQKPNPEQRIVHFNPQGYLFKLHNVFLPGIDFTGGVKCYIGRKHQDFLKRIDGDFGYLSRDHCYLRMNTNGVVLVGEDLDRPSTWGTAVKKARTGLYYRVKPGPDGEVAVEAGDEIILACDYSYTAFPIIVIKQ